MSVRAHNTLFQVIWLDLCRKCYSNCHVYNWQYVFYKLSTHQWLCISFVSQRYGTLTRLWTNLRARISEISKILIHQKSQLEQETSNRRSGHAPDDHLATPWRRRWLGSNGRVIWTNKCQNFTPTSSQRFRFPHWLIHAFKSAKGKLLQVQFDSNDMIIAMFIHTNLPIAMFYFYAFVTTLPSGGSIFGFGIIVCSVLTAQRWIMVSKSSAVCKCSQSSIICRTFVWRHDLHVS